MIVEIIWSCIEIIQVLANAIYASPPRAAEVIDSHRSIVQD
jgi:hypothetical protein